MPSPHPRPSISPLQPFAAQVELTCDSNLYFHYACDLSGQGFKELQEAQGLMVDFGGAAAMLMRMFNTCIKEPHMHLAVFLMTPTGEARLDFIQVRASCWRRAAPFGCCLNASC